MSADFVADGDVFEDNDRSKKRLKFDSNRIVGLFNNERDVVGQTVRNIAVHEKIVVCTGLGVGYRQGLPLRCFAYIVPVLHLLKQMPKSAVAEIYFAFRGGLRANKEDFSEMALLRLWSLLVGRVSGTMLGYVDRYHPELSGRVSVIDDFLCKTPLPGAVDELAKAAWSLYEQDPALRSFVDKRGGEEALRYMAEHALYMRDPLKLLQGRNDWLLVPKMKLDMHRVIMVGGPAEKIFYRVRQHLCQTLGIHSDWVSHQLYTPIGDPPTYNYQEGEPIWGLKYHCVEEIIALYQKTLAKSRTNLIRDFLILLIDISGGRDFQIAKDLARDLSIGKKIDSRTLSKLNAAWQRLIQS